MKLTSQEEYGLRCLLRVGRAGRGREPHDPRARRAPRASRSPNVAKMMRILRARRPRASPRAASPAATRCRGPAGEIVVGQVLAALGGRLYEPAFCDGHSGIERLCTHMPDCSIRSVWRMVQHAVDQVLGKLTLKDLLKSEPEMNAGRRGLASLPTYSPEA